MPAGMFLKSEGFASSLSDPEHRHTYLAYCAERHIDPTAPVALDTFIDYGLWFQQEQELGVEAVEVVELKQADQGFELLLANGERMTARHVVVAVGIGHFAYVPPILAGLPPGLVSHSSHHSELKRFSGQDVTIVGGGQSALETAALLHENGAAVRVLVRKPRIAFHPAPKRGKRSLAERWMAPRAGLGPGWENWFLEHVPLGVHHLPAETRMRLLHQILGPCGAWWLRDRVMGRFPVLVGCTIEQASAEGERARVRILQHGVGESVILTDQVVACTGYRVDVKRLSFLDSGIRAQLRCLEGPPVLSTRFESSVRGLYFVGLAAAQSFGPLLRFVLGANLAAHMVARDIAQKSERLSRGSFRRGTLPPVPSGVRRGLS